MKKRDMDILKNLQRFRCLTRDNIIDLHFSNLKNPITSCNTVLKRMRRDGHIEINSNQQPYIYFPSPAPIKKDSAKIPHFLAIAQFYISLLKVQPPKEFIVEPKYGKSYMEPDAFMIWKNAPFFLEIQRSIYSKKVMDAKFERYMSYYMNGEWKNEAWQPKERKVFPRVLIITDTRYEIPTYPNIHFFQAQNISQFVTITQKRVRDQENSDKLNIRIGNTVYG
ncbi:MULTISPECIES: replication-relaxation family protein [Bacillus]|uniref:replication-relaxation family protein n=1 Tax=Bacillus TaxID=1386 RepID=UPI0002D453B2|nr:MULTISPECIES: replication-relaxation family protein [Bacillus]